MKYFVAFVLALCCSAPAFAQRCTWDSDCPTGYHCNDATDTCRMGRWPDGGCTWDSDCLTGYMCDDEGECKMGRWPDGGCTWDSDCLTGYYCNDATDTCRMGRWPDGGCTWDSDCLSGYECGDDGECQRKPRTGRSENAEAPMCRLLEIAPRSACSPSAARKPVAFGASPRAV